MSLEIESSVTQCVVSQGPYPCTLYTDSLLKDLIETHPVFGKLAINVYYKHSMADIMGFSTLLVHHIQ